MSLFDIEDYGPGRPLKVWRGTEVVGEISNDYGRGWTFHYYSTFCSVQESEMAKLRRIVHTRIALLKITDRLLS